MSRCFFFVAVGIFVVVIVSLTILVYEISSPWTVAKQEEKEKKKQPTRQH